MWPRNPREIPKRAHSSNKSLFTAQTCCCLLSSCNRTKKHREKPRGEGGKVFVQGLKQHPRAITGLQKAHLLHQINSHNIVLLKKSDLSGKP